MNFAELIIYLFNLGVAMGAVLAFIAIAYNGIKLLNSTGNPPSVSEAKKNIINSLLGLAVLLVSYLLLTTINPDIVKLQNISLGGFTISIPVVTPGTTTKSLEPASFQELPIGTITEDVLAGTSSTRNKLPCYEYEHKYKDSGERIIIGNTVDQNGDGKIDGSDILLDKDPFYCMKLLSDAVQKKTEIHLNKLIDDLDKLMKTGCKCSGDSCYYSYNPFSSAGQVFGGFGRSCSTCTSYCQNCCGSSTGCPSALNNSFTDIGGGHLQYKHDPCSNRTEINCKRQEIKQLLDGAKPDKICYDKEFLKEEAPGNLFTIKQGLERMLAFKAYFVETTKDLVDAELKTKEPAGQRITLAEFYKIDSEESEKSITKEQYGNYNIFRYCSEYECLQESASGACIKGKLSDGKRICKIKSGIEQYFYDGDPVTFYFYSPYSYEYTKEEALFSTNKCSIFDRDNTKGVYSGVIPIGEVVDQTEEWGNEVASRIQGVIDEIQNIYDTGTAISDLPQNCDCSNCTHKASNCCYSPACGCEEGPCCGSWSVNSCYECEPSMRKCSSGSNGVCYSYETRSYQGCSSFCGPEPDEDEAADDYWVCPYANFCSLVRKIYVAQNIASSCFEKSDDEEEQAIRDKNLNETGYLQRMEAKENILMGISKTEIKDDKEYEEGETVDLTKTVCDNWLQYDTKKLTCNGGLSKGETVTNRFTLLQKLNLSRTRMNGCVTGFGEPYKQSSTQSRVFTCLEGINLVKIDNLEMGTVFPYPSTNSLGYYNCYPYNLSILTAEQKKKCFENPDRYGDSSNPGCQMEIKTYMDNYYCCE
ncbi:MAG: pilin [Candidatus Paceibacterota bacterium]|jgi:hypothetical protein